jgi:HEPN domain-containing protein
MNRAELQQLTRDRIRDAKALLAAGRWAGAYHMAGYAVECGLKSCVIAYLLRTDLFPERKYSEQCWTHDLERLVVLAGLGTALGAATTADAELDKYWTIVKDWDESSRYARTTRTKAVILYKAITDKKHGVLSWIKCHW